MSLGWAVLLVGCSGTRVEAGVAVQHAGQLPAEAEAFKDSEALKQLFESCGIKDPRL